MPVQVFNSVNDLIAYVQAELPTNGIQEITAARHREVMQSTILSLLSLVTTLPPSTVNQFPAWSPTHTYSGGQQVIVRHLGRLYVFLSGSDDVGTEPTTNALIWREVSAIELAHLQDHDQYLDYSGPYMVSAQQLHALVYAGAPPLSQVLVTGAETGPTHIVLERAVKTDYLEYPGASPAVTLDLNYTAHRVTRSGAVELDYSLWEAGIEYQLVVANGGGTDLDVSWAAGKWSVVPDLSLPATVPPGKSMFVRFRQTGGSLGCLITEAHSGWNNI